MHTEIYRLFTRNKKVTATVEVNPEDYKGMGIAAKRRKIMADLNEEFGGRFFLAVKYVKSVETGKH